MVPPRIRTSALAIVLIPGAVLALEEPDAEPRLVEELAKKLRSSVAVIYSTGRTGDLLGVGSGFFVAEGLLATNLHVIGEGRPFTVGLEDGRKLEPISVRAHDRDRDLALVEVSGAPAPALELASSSEAEPGALAITVGNPLGLGWSVARGVVAERRTLEGKEWIQAAMPIEPGNSGGPLVGRSGRVLGVLAMKSADGVAFAIPAADLRRLMEAEPRAIPMKRWLTIGAIDARRWRPVTSGGSWRQRAGRVVASGMGQGFGGRMICLSTGEAPAEGFEVAVDVKLEDESGAAGLVFHSDGGDVHHGFYPTQGSLRLTRFEGPDVLTWNILSTVESAAYRRGSWNTIKVRVAGPRIECFVNGEKVIEAEDGALRGGSLGLCKFRLPGAEFRRFRSGKEVPDARPGADRDRIAELAARIPEKGPPPPDLLDDIALAGPDAREALERRAAALESEALRLKHVALLVHQRRVERELVEALEGKDSESAPGKAALIVARLDNPDLEPEEYLSILDDMASEIREAAGKDASEADRLAALIERFHGELGFRASGPEYYHRSNSYLNEVIEDREGIPISLSLVFIELGRRVGVPLVGLPVPARFMVGYRPSPEELRIIDVFGGSKTLSREEASALVGIPLEDSDLQPASARAIIIRMLGNLIGLAQQEGDLPGELRYLDAALAVDPASAEERARRAVLRLETGQPRGAAEDIDRLLEDRPAGMDLDRLGELREMLRRRGI